MDLVVDNEESIVLEGFSEEEEMSESKDEVTLNENNVEFTKEEKSEEVVEENNILDEDKEYDSIKNLDFELKDDISSIFDYEINTKENTVKIIKYKSDSKDIVIPKEIKGMPVIGLGDKLFEGREIDSIVFPDTIVNTGNMTFKDTIINGITLPIAEEYGADLFENANIDCDVIFPEGLKKIKKQSATFRNATVKGDVIFPSTIDSYDSNTFKGATINGKVLIAGYSGDVIGYKKVEIRMFAEAKFIDKIEFSGDAKFIRGRNNILGNNKTKVNNIIFNDGVSLFGLDPVFKWFDIEEEVILPHTLTIMQGSAFQDAELKNRLLIPSSVKEIIGGVFESSTIPLLEIEEGVTIKDVDGYIIDDIFASSNIKDLELPKSIDYLPDTMFTDSNFDNIVIYNDKLRIGKDIFSKSEENDKNINIISFNDSDINDYINNLKEEYPGEYDNITFKNFVEINQTLNGTDEDRIIKQGDEFLQEAVIKINESKGYDNFDRRVDRNIDINIGEDLNNNILIESIEASIEKEKLDVINENNKIKIVLPKDKFLGDKEIDLKVNFKIKDDVKTKEDIEIVINADINNIDSSKSEVLKSNVILLKIDKSIVDGNDNENNNTDEYEKDISDNDNIIVLDMTLDANGGQFKNKKSIIRLSKKKKIEEPSRLGYKLIGWSKIKTGEVEKTTEELQEILNKLRKNEKYYAVWEETEKEGKLDNVNHFEYINGYEDKTVRPEQNIIREEVAAVFYRLLNENYKESIFSLENSFKDLTNKRWSNKHISTLAKGNIVKGYEDGEFKYNNFITRAEVAAIVSRFENLDKSNHEFTDIKDHWAEEYIASASKKGWVVGYKDGSFRPDEYITRAEFVTLVNRLLNRGVKKENILEAIKEFKDLKDKTWYYEEFIEAINGHEFNRDDENNRTSEKWLELKDFNVDM